LPKQDCYRYRGIVLFHHGGGPPQDLWEAGTRPFHVDVSICLNRTGTGIEVLSSFSIDPPQDLWEAGTRPLHVDISIRLNRTGTGTEVLSSNHGGGRPQDLWEAGTRPLHVDISIRLNRTGTGTEVLSSNHGRDPPQDLWEVGARPLHVYVSVCLNNNVLFDGKENSTLTGGREAWTKANRPRRSPKYRSMAGCASACVV
jgi:hypothetical protein